MDEVAFAFFLTDTTQLIEAERRFTLAPADIALINPNTLTAPVFRAKKDLELTTKIVGLTPILSNNNGFNPWSFNFMTKMFDMADSSSSFQTQADLIHQGAERYGLG